MICLSSGRDISVRFFHSRPPPMPLSVFPATSIKGASLRWCQKRGFIWVGGVTSTGIVRLAHMEGPGLSPRDNRESLSSRYTWTGCRGSFQTAFTTADSSALPFLLLLRSGKTRSAASLLCSLHSATPLLPIDRSIRAPSTPL